MIFIKTIPCKKCLKLAACKHKIQIDCQDIFNYMDTKYEWRHLNIWIFKFRIKEFKKYLPKTNRLWGDSRNVDGIKMKLYIDITREEKSGYYLGIK